MDLDDGGVDHGVFHVGIVGDGGVAEARDAWRASQSRLTRHRLVFLDETWAKTNMARAYGRSPRGTRLVSAEPHGHWKTTTLGRPRR